MNPFQEELTKMFLYLDKNTKEDNDSRAKLQITNRRWIAKLLVRRNTSKVNIYIVLHLVYVYMDIGYSLYIAHLL